jgi:hypothetical protein
MGENASEPHFISLVHGVLEAVMNANIFMLH